MPRGSLRDLIEGCSRLLSSMDRNDARADLLSRAIDDEAWAAAARGGASIAERERTLKQRIAEAKRVARTELDALRAHLDEPAERSSK